MSKETISKLETRIPRNTIKRIMKENTDYEYSADTIEYVRGFLEEILLEVCKKANSDMEEDNHYRSLSNRRIRKRIDLSLIKSFSVNLLKWIADNLNGNVGKYNGNTTLSTEANEVIKC